jgi:hypothetical protein
MNYLGEYLGGCSMRMDELEACWLQVSEVGEAGCHQEESVLSNATTEKTAIFLVILFISTEVIYF